jgi:type III secretion protein R
MTISLPLKLLLFVMVSGWSRLLDSLFLSYL